jgi:hypothetical protein
MPIYDLRILLETIEGKKTSYYSSGSNFLPNNFINTAVDGNFMSASMVSQRLTRMVSASYQNESTFTGEVVNGGGGNSPNYFSGNTLLSVALSGSANTGSIVFTALDTEYDRLLRYKFIGEKVTNVLGLPSDQWIYVDQVRLPVDDEANIFQGNANLGNVNISDTLTFAGGSDVNSDVPILIDTGSDRYIKFVDERAASVVALRMGYDVDTDTYEISGSDNFNFNIGNVNDIFVTDNILHQDDVDTGISFLSDLVTITAGGVEMMRAVESDIGDVVTFNEGGKDVNFRVESTGSAHMLFVDGGTNRIGINKQSPTHTLTVGGEISASGLVVAGGDIITTGDIIAENYIVKSTVTQMTTSFSSGSTIFGDTPSDDTHQFTGSVSISGSGNDLIVGGNVGIGNLNPPFALTVEGSISASGGIIMQTPQQIRLNGNVSDDRIFYSTANGINIDSNEGTSVYNDLRVNTFGNSGKALTVEGDISGSGDLNITNITASGNIGVGNIINHIGDDDTKITFTDDDINITVGGVNMIDITQDTVSEITFNEGSADLDFRVEGNGDANLLFTDAGNDKVGIGTNAPPKKLTVAGAISASQNIFIGTGGGSDEKKIIHSGDEDTHLLFDENKVNLVAGGSSAIKLEKSTGKIFINNSNHNLDTQIMADDGEVILHTDAGDNRVGINTTVPTKALQVTGDISASGDLFKTKFVQMTNSSSVIDTFNTGSFRSAKYTLQVTSASNFQVSELLVLHHNSTASNTEYAQINSGLNLIDFTTDVNNSNVRLNAAGSFISCSVRLDRIIIPT